MYTPQGNPSPKGNPPPKGNPSPIGILYPGKSFTQGNPSPTTCHARRNRFDAAVVAISLTTVLIDFCDPNGTSVLMQLVRILRIVRIAKLIPKIKSLRLMFQVGGGVWEAAGKMLKSCPETRTGTVHHAHRQAHPQD